MQNKKVEGKTCGNVELNVQMSLQMNVMVIMKLMHWMNVKVRVRGHVPVKAQVSLKVTVKMYKVKVTK